MKSAIDSNMGPELHNRLNRCREILRSLGSVVVAFSAGVDSTFLLALAVETLGSRNVLAAMGISPSLPQRERQAGRRIAHQIGVELVEVETTELSDPHYVSNPPDRCYYCKINLFKRLKKLSARRGIRAVVSGANADDTGDFRPGLLACKELDIRNPLLEAGLTKKEIRLASRAMGLETWNKPAMACLATRVPYGDRITIEKLQRIDQAESILKDLGFSQCRVRDHDVLARIEVPTDEIAKVVEFRETLIASLKSLGYIYITLDMEGFRSGSMNESLTTEIRLEPRERNASHLDSRKTNHA